MEWCTVVVVVIVCLVQCVYVNSDNNYFLKYGQLPTNFLTLEGETIGVQRRSPQRSKRFIKFNNDESNIRVEVEFSVPFLEIPLDTKHGTLWGIAPKLSVNAKSAIVVATLFFVSYFIVPKLVQIFFPKIREHHYGRDLEVSEIDRLVRGVETALHVNATACWQQGVCSLVRGSRDNTSTAGLGKVLDGLSSMNWVESLTRGTALDEAFISARQDNHGCQVFNSRCVLSSNNSKSFPELQARRYMNLLIELYNSRSRTKK